MTLDENTLALAYNYLDDIEAFFAGSLTEERLTQVLVSMANDGLAWQLTGPLSREFTQRIEDGRIQSVVQNAWDEWNECVIEAAYEQTYFSRADAELVRRCQEKEAA